MAKTKFIFTDIHGNFKTFMALIDKVAEENVVDRQYIIDNMVVCGDLEDRGPDSCSIIQFCIDNNIPVVMGNHELMMIDNAGSEAAYYLKQGHFDGFCWTHGALETMESYLYKDGEKNKLDTDKLFKHIDWMKQLPLYIEFKDVVNEDGRYLVISHSNIHNIWNNRGEIERAKKLEKEFLEKMDSLTVKERFEFKKTQEYLNLVKKLGNAQLNAGRFEREIVWGRQYPKKGNDEIYNVHGHTPQQDGPRIKKIFSCIDTGCFYKGERGYFQLTCLQFPEMKITTHRNIDYDDIKKSVYDD